MKNPHFAGSRDMEWPFIVLCLCFFVGSVYFAAKMAAATGLAEMK